MSNILFPVTTSDAVATIFLLPFLLILIWALYDRRRRFKDKSPHFIFLSLFSFALIFRVVYAYKTDQIVSTKVSEEKMNYNPLEEFTETCSFDHDSGAKIVVYYKGRKGDKEVCFDIHEQIRNGDIRL